MRRLLHEISEDLCQAIGESPAVGSKLAELQAAGYSLNLLLDCRETGESEGEPAVDSPPNRRGSLQRGDAGGVLANGRLGRKTGSQSAEPGGKTKPVAEDPAVGFRIDAKDLAFLRSVGIDPTKPARSKSSRRDSKSLASHLDPNLSSDLPSDANLDLDSEAGT